MLPDRTEHTNYLPDPTRVFRGSVRRRTTHYLESELLKDTNWRMRIHIVRLLLLTGSSAFSPVIMCVTQTESFLWLSTPAGDVIHCVQPDSRISLVTTSASSCLLKEHPGWRPVPQWTKCFQSAVVLKLDPRQTLPCPVPSTSAMRHDNLQPPYRMTTRLGRAWCHLISRYFIFQFRNNNNNK